MDRKSFLVAAGLALMLGLATAGPAAEAGQPDSTAQPGERQRFIEPRAAEVLKEMCDLLAGSQRLAFEAEEVFDEIPDGLPRVHLSNLRRMALERPRRLAADVTGDTLNRAVWYDGKRITVLDRAHNTYAGLDESGGVDQLLDRLQDEFGVVVPLTDFLYSDPCAVHMEGITYGRYLGLHQAAGVSCHHLVFAQETIEWQIWIEAGAEPLPRKLVLTYVLEPGEPQYAATFQRWRLDPRLPAELFTFTAPEGAEQVELERFLPGEAAEGGQE